MRTAPPTAIGEAGDTAEKVRNSDLSNPRRAPSSTPSLPGAMPEALADLATAIKAEHAAARDALGHALRHALRAGELLIAAQDKVPHGAWLTWLQDNTEISARTSRLYMMLARRVPDLPDEDRQRVANLSLREAARLVAEPKAVEQPEISTPTYIPSPGHMLTGRAGDVECVIAPSRLPDFYFVTVLSLTDDGGADVQGLYRPIRAEGIAPMLMAANFPARDAAWEMAKCKPQDRNLYIDEAPAAMLIAQATAAPADIASTPAPKPTISAELAEKAAPASRNHTLDVMGSSETSEWYTPQRVADLVVDLLGSIDLDPSWHPASPVRATTTYTAADDGLAQEWKGRVYLNPPYGREIDAWIEKLVAAYEAGTVTEAVALVPARVDTQWFGRLDAFPRCFVSGRLTFANADNPAPFPSAVVYLGADMVKFAKVFGAVGGIFTRWLAERGR